MTMCRMFAFVGSNDGAFDDIYSSLVEVSKQDPLSGIVSKSKLSHSDGWGYVDSGKLQLKHARQSEPIFQMSKPHLTGDYRVVHARNAAKDQPLGMLNAHPHMRASDMYDLYLVHNGWLDKRKVDHGLSEKTLANRTDSEVFLDLLASMRGLAIDMFRSAIETVYQKDALISGLNLFLLSVDREKVSRELLVYSDAKEFNEYHQLYYFGDSAWNAVVSSSLPLASRFPKYVLKIPLKTGTIYSLDENGLHEKVAVARKE